MQRFAQGLNLVWLASHGIEQGDHVAQRSVAGGELLWQAAPLGLAKPGRRVLTSPRRSMIPLIWPIEDHAEHDDRRMMPMPMIMMAA